MYTWRFAGRGGGGFYSPDSCDECEDDRMEEFWEAYDNAFAFKRCRTCHGVGSVDCECAGDHHVIAYCFKCDNDGDVACADCRGRGMTTRF